jgi:protein ImuB
MRAGHRRGKTKERAAEVQNILKILHKWGVHTLGDLAALEKDKLAARLGTEAVRLWERANGRSCRLLQLIQPPESFLESFEFEHEIETIEPLLFILRRLLQQLSIRLTGIYLVATELTLRITFSNKQQYERCFKIPQPTNEVDLLFRMLHTHLESFQSDHPVVAVSLQGKPARPAQQQFGLFETALRDPNQLYQTLTRLIGLLGAERVGTPVMEETHRPDAFQMEAFSGQLGEEEDKRASPGLKDGTPSMSPASIALRRFRPARAASVLLEENRPIHLRSAEVSGAVTDRSGPYFASGQWWDEHEWKREEWDLDLEEGAIVRCHEKGEGWEIDGIYD